MILTHLQSVNFVTFNYNSVTLFLAYYLPFWLKLSLIANSNYL